MRSYPRFAVFVISAGILAIVLFGLGVGWFTGGTPPSSSGEFRFLLLIASLIFGPLTLCMLSFGYGIWCGTALLLKREGGAFAISVGATVAGAFCLVLFLAILAWLGETQRMASLYGLVSAPYLVSLILIGLVVYGRMPA